MRGFNWVKPLFGKLRQGVVFPEEFFIIPIIVKYGGGTASNPGDKEIVLKEDGSIEGNFNDFDKWMRETIVKAFPDERIIFWLLREHWKLKLAMEDENFFNTTIVRPTLEDALKEMKDLIPVIEVPTKEFLDVTEEDKGVHEIAVVTKPAEEPEPEAPKDNPLIPAKKKKVIIMNTVDGPKEFEI